MTKPAHSIKRTGRPLRLTRLQYLRLEDDMVGTCRACGEEREMCEPDGRKYLCPVCQAPEVYGIEELLAREEVEII